MAEPQDMVLEILKEVRADFRRLEGKVDRVDAKAEALIEKVDDLEIKLDGLTHAVIAGFGSLVHELDIIKTRVTGLEAERA